MKVSQSTTRLQTKLTRTLSIWGPWRYREWVHLFPTKRNRANFRKTEKVMKFWKTMLVMPKSCSSMTWRSRSARMNNWMRSKRHYRVYEPQGKSLRRADNHPSWNGDDHLCRWSANSLLRRASSTQPRIIRSVSWSRLTIHVRATILKVSKRWSHGQNKPAASWENPENPQHQQAFVSLYDDVKSDHVTKDCMNTKSLETIDSCNTSSVLLRWTWWLGIFPNTRSTMLTGLWGWICSRMPSSSGGASQLIVEQSFADTDDQPSLKTRRKCSSVW